MKFTIGILLLFTINITCGCSYQKTNENMLHHLVREPKIKSDKPPLIILLHGYRSNEQDLFSLAPSLPDKFLVVSARGPYTISEGSYMWYQADFSKEKPIINKEQAESSRKVILEFIEQLKIEHSFDETQVYLVGFSQGAIMSYNVGLTEPMKIKGFAAMSGRIPDEIETKVASKDKLQHLSVFISHGTIDNVLKIENARNAKEYLKKLNIIPTYKEYPEPHTISQEMLTDLIDWLNKK